MNKFEYSLQVPLPLSNIVLTLKVVQVPLSNSCASSLSNSILPEEYFKACFIISIVRESFRLMIESAMFCISG